MLDNVKKKQRIANITYTQVGISCFVGQERGKLKVLFFVGSSEVKSSFGLLSKFGLG